MLQFRYAGYNVGKVIPIYLGYEELTFEIYPKVFAELFSKSDPPEANAKKTSIVCL